MDVDLHEKDLHEDVTLLAGVDVEVRAAPGRPGGAARAIAYTAGLGECGHPELWMGPDPAEGPPRQELEVEERAGLLLRIAHAVLDGTFGEQSVLTGTTEDGGSVVRCRLGRTAAPPSALSRSLAGARVVRPVLWRLLDPDADLDVLDALADASGPPDERSGERPDERLDAR